MQRDKCLSFVAEVHAPFYPTSPCDLSFVLGAHVKIEFILTWNLVIIKSLTSLLKG